ncbi:MAG: hypothetical protein ABSA44_04230 [Bacteroidota bacterium]|jgi:hypothetical protein
MIKGQMLQEAKFKPAYRYEPFVDINGQVEFSQSKYDRFRITSPTDFGKVEIPSTHTNVYPSPYLKYQGRIWDYFFAHSKTLNPNVSDDNNLYPMYNSNQTLLWYKDAARTYNYLIMEYVMLGGDLSSGVNAANNWLENFYGEGQGCSLTQLAQTRMASSYGLLQILYGTAQYSQKYPVDDDHSPEKLNENETNLTYATRYFLKLLNKNINNMPSQWKNGFEQTLELIYSEYRGDNAISQYGKNVINYAKNKFSPEN